MVTRSFRRFFQTRKATLSTNAKKERAKIRPEVVQLEDRLVPASPFTAGNLAVLQAANNSSDTSGSILEINPTTSTLVQTIAVNNVLISGGAGTVGYLADSDNGTLLTLQGYQPGTSPSNVNVIPQRYAVAFDSSGNQTLGATYNAPNAASSTNTSRSSATFDGNTYYFADQGGLYTNNEYQNSGTFTTALEAMKPFGGTMYEGSKSTTGGAVEIVPSPTSTTLTALSGVPKDSNFADFYMISSGVNGSTYDVLYTLDVNGAINKFYSANGTTWTAAGSDTTSLSAASRMYVVADGSGAGYTGATLYITTEAAGTNGNSLIALTDSSAWNANINVTGAAQTLYTATGTNVLYGVAAVPVAGTTTLTTVSAPSYTPASVVSAGTVTFAATVTASEGSAAPPAGSVEFFGENVGASTGTLLATATSETTSGTSATFTVITHAVANGSYTNIYATYIPGTGFTGSASLPASGTLLVGAVNTTTATPTFSPDTVESNQPVTFSTTVTANSGTAAPPAGNVEFVNGTGANMVVLATATTETTSGDVATFSVSSVAPIGTYTDVYAIYSGSGSFLSSNSSASSSTLTVTAVTAPPGALAQWTFDNDAIAGNNSPAPSYGAGTALALGMTNSYNGTTSVNTDDVLLGTSSDTGTNGLADLTNIWRVRGQNPGNGWSSQAPIGTQGAEFQVSTLNDYGSITVSADWYATSAGEANMMLEYTDDANAATPTWNNLKLAVPTADTNIAAIDNTNASDTNTVQGWYVQMTGGQQWAQNLTATINDPAADNNPYFAIELVNASTGADCIAAGGGALNNTSGNWRFDNITVTAQTPNFTPGNLVELQAGDGTNAYVEAPTYLDEVTTSGASVQQVPVTTSTATQSGATGIAAATESGTTITVTTSTTALYSVGESITLSGIAPSAWDITEPVASVISATQFTIQGPANLPTITSLTGAQATPPNQPLVIALNQAAGNGQLNRSYDGSALTFDGVDSTTTGTSDNTSYQNDDRDLAVVSGNPNVSSDINTATYGQWNANDDNRDSVAETAYGPIYQAGHPSHSAGFPTYGGVNVFNTEEGPSQGQQVSAATNIRGITIGPDNRMYFSAAAGNSSVSKNAGIFTEPTALPTQSSSTPSQDIMIVPALITNAKLNGVYIADMNGTGVISNGDRLYFIDDGTEGGANTGGLYVATWNTSNDYPWDTPNNAGAAAAGILDYWGVPVRLGDAPDQPGSTETGNLVGLTGTVLYPNSTQTGATASWSSANGGTATVTLTSAPQFAIGASVTVSGMSLTGYNGTVVVTAVSGNTFSYALASNPGGAATGGTVTSQGTVELYTSADNTVANDYSVIQQWTDQGSGVTITSASELGTTVTITTASPINFQTGDYVTVDGIVDSNATAGPGQLDLGYNGTWQVTVTGTNTFTYSDFNVSSGPTDSGAGGIGAADVADIADTNQTGLPGSLDIGAPQQGTGVAQPPDSFGGTIIQTLYGGTDGSLAYNEVALRGIAFAPVAATTVTLANNSGTLTATLTNNQVPPSGQVAFVNENTGAVLGFGTITPSSTPYTYTATLPASTVVGDAYVHAYFAGGGTLALAPAQSNTITVQNAGTTTDSVSVSPSVAAVAVNTPVTFTATVTPSTGPTGNVSFYNTTGGAQPSLANLIGTVALTGNTAALTTEFSSTGTQTITAVYNGDGTYEASSNSTTENVAANATATITSSANNITNLTSTPSYTVTLNGNATLGAPAGTVKVTIVSATDGSNGNPLISQTSSALSLTGSGNNASATWTSAPELTTAGSYLVTMTYTPASGSGYSGFSITTEASGANYTNTALIENVVQAFTPGDVVLVQRGDGSLNTGSSGGLVELDEYSPTGGEIQSIVLPNSPTGSNNPFVLGSQNGSQGLIQRSYNGADLTLIGYDTSLGTEFLTSTFPYQIPRTIAEVGSNAAGAVNTTTAISSTSPTTEPFEEEDAVSNDGNEFWIVSSIGNTSESGIEYVGSVGATSATELTAPDTTGNAITIAGGQLYTTAGSGNVDAVGTGLPTAPTASLTGLPNLLNQYQDYFPGKHAAEQVLLLNTNDGTTNNPNVAYVADQGNGLLKFTLNNASISLTSSGTTATATVTSGNLYFLGNGSDQVQITGAPGYNGTYTLPAASINGSGGAGTTFTFTTTGSNLASTTGTAGQWLYGEYGSGIFGQKLLFAGGITGVTGNISTTGSIGSYTAQLYVTGANVQGSNPNEFGSLTDNSSTPGFPSGNFNLDAVVGASGSSASPNANSDFAGIAFVPGYVTNTTLAATATSLPYGSSTSVTYTATVTSTGSGDTPAGTVLFYNGSTLLGSAPITTVGGHQVATFTTSFPTLAVGAYTITATYNPGGSELAVDDMSSGFKPLDITYNTGDIIVDAVTTQVGGGIASITESGTTATVTTNSAHGLATGNSVTIAGAAVSGYNGTFTITVTGATTFTFTAASGLANAGAGGTVTPNNLGATTSLLDYSSSGTLNSGNTITLPSTGSGALTENATATNEGYLTDSSNGQSLEFAGYNVAADASTAGTNSTTGPNALIGVLSADGVVNDSTVIPYANTQETTTGSSPKSANSVKAVASADGLGFYVATDDFIQYVPFGNTATTPTTTIEQEFTANDGTSGQFASSQSPNDVALGGSDVSNTTQLYGDAGSEAQTDGVPAADGPFSVGTGLPTTNGQSTTVYGGPSTSEANGAFVTSEQFSFSPTGESFFVADARTNGAGGLYLYQESTTATGFVQTAAYNYTSTGLTGLSVNWNASGGPIVYAVTTNANPGNSGNSIVEFQTSVNESLGSGSIAAPTLIATAPSTEAFRGVAFAPAGSGTATTSSTSLSVSNNNGQYGSVTLQATVTGSSPTGYVSFQTSTGVEIGSAPVVGGTATLTPATDLLAGSYTGLVAVYSGDANNTPSTSSGVSATVAKYSTFSTLTDADSGTASNGSADLLTDTLSVPAGSDPTGTVTFYNGSTELGTGTVNQVIVNGSPTFVATYSWTPSAVGTDGLSAVYGGDSNFTTTTSNETVTVINPTTTVVTSNAQDPSGNGGTVTFTATVNGTSTGGVPAGQVQFYINGIAIGSPVTVTQVSGSNDSAYATLAQTASLTETGPGTLTPGVDSVTAVFTAASSPSYANSSGNLNQAVQASPLVAGDTLVYQVGDTTTTNFNSSDAFNENVVYIDEYTPTGTLVEQIVMPSVTSNGYYAFTQQTDNGTAGFINQTASGNGYVFGGVDYGVGAIPSGTTAPASLAFLSNSGTLTINTVDTANQGYQLRSVASVNGTSFYEGTSNGVYYIKAGTDGAAVGLNTTITGRNILIAPAPTGGEQLYISSASNGGVATVGTGLPTTTGQTLTLLSSTMPSEIGSSFGPYDFKFAELQPSDGYSVDTLYVLNDSTGSTGGLQKWTYSSSGWTYTTVNSAGNTSTTEDTAVGISVTGGVATLSVMSDTQFAATPGGQVVTLTDNSGYGGTGFASASVNSLESAPANTSWHGDAYVAVATQTVVTSTVASAADSGASILFTATVTSTNATPAVTPTTGTIQFYDGLVPLGSPVALNSSGVAQVTVTTALIQQSGLYITPGIDSITAVYSGDFDGDDNADSGIASSTGTINQVVQTQAFGSGDQFVYRVGDGTSNATTGNGSAVFVDEYNAAGTLQQSIAMPTADAAGTDSNYYHALVQLGNKQTVGQLTLSGDGQYVFLAGYDDTPTSTSSPATDNALRTIARIAYNGAVTTETINNAAVTSGSFGSYVSAVYSPDGNQVYIGGYEAFGIDYLSSWQPGLATQAATSIVSFNGNTTYANVISLQVSGNVLYAVVQTDSTGANSYNVDKVSTSTSGQLPTTSGQTLSAILGSSITPYTPVDAYFAPNNTLYVSSSAATSSSPTGAGSITKYSLVSGSWVSNGTILAAPTPSSGQPYTGGTPGVWFISGSYNNATGAVTLYTTYDYYKLSAGAITGELETVSDTAGFNSAPSSTSLTEVAESTDGPAYQFHGVAHVPQGLVQTVGLNAATTATISTATESGTTVTITTTAPQYFFVGEPVAISNVSVSGYNGVFYVTGVPSATTFTYTAASGLGAGTGGTASDALAAQPAGGEQHSMVDSIVYTFAQPVSLGANAFTLTVNGLTPVSTATESGNTVTITTGASETFVTGEVVTVAGDSVAGYNGAWPITVVNSTHFTYTDPTSGLGSGTGGTAGVGEAPTVNYSSSDGGTTWVVTFSGPGVTADSIADGIYNITLNPSAITMVNSGTIVAQTNRGTDTFYRLYGDINGDGRVNNTDFGYFNSSFGLRNTNNGFIAAFDINGDGRVNNTDFGFFNANFGKRFSGFTSTL